MDSIATFPVESLPKNIKRNFHPGFRRMFKDMDINWKEMKFLIAITFATVCLASINIHFSGGMIDRTHPFGGIAFIVGILLGLFGGLVIVDRLEHKIPLLTALFITSPVLSIWGIINRIFTGATETPALLFALNIMLVIFAITIDITIFIEYTTILDRGRVIALVLIVTIFFTILMYLFILNGYFALIPSLFPILVGFLLYRKRDDEKGFGEITILSLLKKKDLKPDEGKENVSHEEIKDQNSSFASTNLKNRMRLKRSSKNFIEYILHTKDFLYYFMVLFAGGIIVGLLVPIDQFVDILLSTQENTQYFTVIVFVSVFLAIGAFLIGFVFDFYGRKQMISLLILAVAIVNFTNTFQMNQIQTVPNLALMVAVLFVLGLSVPLLCGDLVPPEFHGRTAIIWIIGILLGFIVGYFIKSVVIIDLIDDLIAGNILFYNYILSSIIFLASVFILFILSNIQSDLSKDEQNWLESLIHLYIVHNSGLLIYEHSFKSEEDLAESDLISGGLIGLVSMLKEITRGSTHLRIIDHGDKKLLFQWDLKEQVIFVMVVERDLLFIRYKLGKFIEAFESKYSKRINNFIGVNDSIWKSVEDLILLYFTRKYLRLGIEEILGSNK